MTGKRFGHAIVVGSGIAGLVTARVLSDHFARVTVLERDAAPEGAAPRPGVPQARHFHALLPGGLKVLSDLFPGVTDEMLAAGSLRPTAQQFDFFRPVGKSYLLSAYSPEPPPEGGPRPYVQSRGLLEHCVRRRVAALANVELRYRAHVEGISRTGARATGVQLAGGPLEAELVVDATGRGARILHWLDELGFERPVENAVHCDFAYSSVLMRPRSPDVFTDVGFFVMRKPQIRGGSLVRLEHGVWLASVAGRYGDYPPHDLPGFLAFAESAGEPYFSQLLAQADAIGEPVGYRFNKSVRRRFELLTQFPEGVLPIGDAFCHYNPLFGQGMSAACRQALALSRVLSEHAASHGRLDGLWRAFLPAAHQETRAPWLFAALADFRDPRCTGDFPHEEAELTALLGYVIGRAATGDREALQAMLAVQSLSAPLESLRQPPWPERMSASQS